MSQSTGDSHDDLIDHVLTRRSGIKMFVEIGLGFHAERRMGDVDLVIQAVRRDVEATIPGATVTIVATALRSEQEPHGVS